MAIKHGDPVTDDCTKLGPFPAGTVADFKSMHYYPGAGFGNKLFLASRKKQIIQHIQYGQTTLDHFGHGIRICNFDSFATAHNPTICRVRKPVIIPKVTILGSAGGYVVGAHGYLGYRDDQWSYQWKQSPWQIDIENSLSGSIAFDIVAGPETYFEYSSGILGSFYTNTVFACTITIEYYITHIGDGTPFDPMVAGFNAHARAEYDFGIKEDHFSWSGIAGGFILRGHDFHLMDSPPYPLNTSASMAFDFTGDIFFNYTVEHDPVDDLP